MRALCKIGLFSLLIAVAPFRFVAHGQQLVPALITRPTTEGSELKSEVRIPIDRDCRLRPGLYDDRIQLDPCVQIDLRSSTSKEGDFQGIARIKIAGVAVMDSLQVPMRVSLAGPGLTEPQRMILRKVTVAPSGRSAKIHTDLILPNGEKVALLWHFATEKNEWEGTERFLLTYWFSLSQTQRQINYIVERSTWKLGASLGGLLFIEQLANYYRNSTALVLSSDTFITAQKSPPKAIFADSRLGNGDYMDYLGAANISLARYPVEPDLSLRSFSKRAGTVAHMDAEERYLVSGDKVASPKMRVSVYARGGVNGWLSARRSARDALERSTGLRVPKAVPTIILSDLLLSKTGQHYRLRPKKLVTLLADLGFKHVWIWGPWRSNADVWSELSPSMRARMGTVPYGHAVWTLDWSDRAVDLKWLKKFTQELHAAGLKLILWAPGGHLSRYAPLGQERPAALLKGPDGSTYSYAYPDIAGYAYESGYSRYMSDALRFRRSEVPFDGLFLDSFQVFGLNAMNYVGGRASPNLYGALEHLRDLRNQGMYIESETLTPFTVSASGGIYSLSDIDQFPFLAFGTHKHIGAVDKKLTPSRYFRTLAYGAPPKLDYKQILDQPEMRDFVPVRNRVYLEHLEHLVTCYSLAGYGTIWWNNDHSAATVFAFENAQLDLGFDVKEIEDLLNGEVYSGQQWSRRFKVNGIYRLVLN